MRLTWISAVICLFTSVLLVQCGGGPEMMESETPSTVVEHTDWPMFAVIIRVRGIQSFLMSQL